jgi:endonuclease YncB( thermonuclease family)
MRIRRAALALAALIVAALPFALGRDAERMVAQVIEAVWRQAERPAPGPETPADAVRVTDGDTLVIGEERIRLFGIDAPEISQHCQEGGRDVACGRLARQHLEELVRGGEGLRCTAEARDRYERTVARCTRSDGVELNRAMVRQGWALAYMEYGGEAYARDEQRARADRLGLHGMTAERPDEYRRRQRNRD